MRNRKEKKSQKKENIINSDFFKKNNLLWVKNIITL